MTRAETGAAEPSRPMTGEERKVILASSLGTIFEWYDFFLYGSLAAIIGAQFFSGFPESTRNIFALLAFSAGFIVRPLGALVFGRIGDKVGRKYTFLVTIVIMGLSTFLVGLLPGYEAWGVASPVILIALRMLQGLALGGEFGGAATYVAEHAPRGRRGYYTSFIQTTTSLGLLLSLIVILVAQGWVNATFAPVPQMAGGVPVLGPDGQQVMLDPFRAWGWRIPFLGSSVLLAISLYIRLRMQESPAFQAMKRQGAGSRAPLREAFGRWKNARIALIALFGLVAGQAVVSYSSQFYALFFIGNVVKLDSFTTNVLVAWSLILSTAIYVFWGALSDRVGRKPIVIAGLVLAALSLFPVFGAMTRVGNPALAAAQAGTAVTVTADPATCSFQFNPTGRSSAFTSSCDIAKALLAKSSVNYATRDAAAGTPASVSVGATVIPAYEGTLAAGDLAAAKAGFEGAVRDALAAAGYPQAGSGNEDVAKARHFLDIFGRQNLTLVALLTYLNLLVTMVCGPTAAALVELFPTRIRYSGMSLPYHIGNGWFGGLLPATAFAISAQAGNIYAGLWYAVIVASATAVIGFLLVPWNGHRRSLFDDDTARPARAPHRAGDVLNAG